MSEEITRQYNEGILNVDYNHFWIYSEKGIRNTRTFIFGNGERRRLSDDKINWYKQMTTEDVKWEPYFHEPN